MTSPHERALIAAAITVAAREHAAAGLIPIPGTDPQMFVGYGDVDQLISLLQQQRAHSIS